MSCQTVSGALGWRARAVTVMIAVAALGLFAAGCGGTQPSASGVPRPSPGSTSASPARSLPTATMTTQGPAPAPAASQTPSAPVTDRSGPVFQASTSALTAATRSRMTGVSWHPGCPVPLSALRLLRLSYWGFDHAVRQGELIVNASAAGRVTQAFRLLFAARFPIRQMRVVDDFGGDDERSMPADNTSAFNCRLVPGTSVWAQHAYGLGSRYSLGAPGLPGAPRHPEAIASAHEL
jgi:poly-gamma-glutamate synthesis protein (capsule biosynthesis protein)